MARSGKAGMGKKFQSTSSTESAAIGNVTKKERRSKDLTVGEFIDIVTQFQILAIEEASSESRPIVFTTDVTRQRTLIEFPCGQGPNPTVGGDHGARRHEHDIKQEVADHVAAYGKNCKCGSPRTKVITKRTRDLNVQNKLELINGATQEV
jgi:hypothetical protein